MSVASVFISVADPSADANASLLAAEVRALRPGWKLRGVGGPAMRAAGVVILEDTVAGAAMGVAAVGRAMEVSRLLARIAAEFDRDKPVVVVCIDSWSMNAHVARLAKDRGIPVLYYVAPQTWASREGRVRKLRLVVDKLCCILPFEEPYFRKFGVDASYVGHPLWDRIRVGERRASASSDAASVGVGGGASSPAPIVAVLPGSRKGVTRANWPRLRGVMDRLRTSVPGVRFRLPLTRNAAAIVRATPLPADVEIREGDDAMDELLPGCDLALCVSGTAALHVAAHYVPLIVVYHGNPLLWHLIGRWVVRTRTYSLVNLLSGEPGQITKGRYVAPEYIPWYGSVEPVATHAIRLLTSPDELAKMRAELARVVAPLSRPGASARVAREVVSLAGRGG